MKTLYMMKGLPASGKTTKAKEMLSSVNNIVRVNKDELRSLIHNGTYSKHNEKLILKTRDSIIELALEQGNHVICDDTNLAPKHELKLREIAKAHNAKFKIIDMTDVSPEECIKRDLQREKSVGSEVIMSMYNTFLKKEIPKVEYNPILKDVYICDIDGTIALMTNRGPYDLSKVSDDIPNQPIVDIISTLGSLDDITIIFVSGRDDSCYEETFSWLCKNFLNIRKFGLFTRKFGDTRKDSIVKKEIYEEHIKDKYNVLAVFDDRQQVVDMWREQGLTCLQVAEGNF